MRQWRAEMRNKKKFNSTKWRWLWPAEWRNITDAIIIGLGYALGIWLALILVGIMALLSVAIILELAKLF